MLSVLIGGRDILALLRLYHLLLLRCAAILVVVAENIHRTTTELFFPYDQEEEKPHGRCVVCLEDSVDSLTIFEPCRHAVCCFSCALCLLLDSRRGFPVQIRCPICRKAVCAVRCYY